MDKVATDRNREEISAAKSREKEENPIVTRLERRWIQVAEIKSFSPDFIINLFRKGSNIGVVATILAL